MHRSTVRNVYKYTLGNSGSSLPVSVNTLSSVFTASRKFPSIHCGVHSKSEYLPNSSPLLVSVSFSKHRSQPHRRCLTCLSNLASLTEIFLFTKSKMYKCAMHCHGSKLCLTNLTPFSRPQCTNAKCVLLWEQFNHS